eukprot:528692-Amorphochlora_amoeboformis.AAC.1
MKRTCCVCWDDRPLSEGVECFPTSAEGKAHFHCNKCFDRLVKVQAQDCAQIKVSERKEELYVLRVRNERGAVRVRRERVVARVRRERVTSSFVLEGNEDQ